MPTLTITTTAQQAQRLATAFGKAHSLKDDVTGLPRDATAAEVKSFVIDWMRSVVLDQERLAAALALVDQVFTPT